jgi:hypothetical protein
MKKISILFTIFLLSFTSLIRTTMSEEASEEKGLSNFDRLWDYDHPDKTEQKFRDLLPKIKMLGDASLLLQLQTQIARCQGLRGKFEDAHRTLDEVEKQLTDDHPVARVRYLLERGRVFNSSDHPDKAKPLFAAAWERANATKEIGFAIDAAHMIAIAESDVSKQIEWNLKGLTLVEKDSKQERWLPSLWNNLGESYRLNQQYDKALECFEKRAQWFRDRKREPDIYNLKDIARMNRLLKKAELGLKTIEPVAKDLASKKTPDGYISAEYGQCLMALGRKDEAKPYLVEAYKILSKDEYMVKYEQAELQQIKTLAEIRD